MIMPCLQLLEPPGSTRGIAHVREGKSRLPVSRGRRDRCFDPCGRGSSLCVCLFVGRLGHALYATFGTASQHIRPNLHPQCCKTGISLEANGARSGFFVAQCVLGLPYVVQQCHQGKRYIECALPAPQHCEMPSSHAAGAGLRLDRPMC